LLQVCSSKRMMLAATAVVAAPVCRVTSAVLGLQSSKQFGGLASLVQQKLSGEFMRSGSFNSLCSSIIIMSICLYS